MTLRKEYTKELSQLHNEMIRLGSLVEAALENARTSLMEYNKDLATEVIKNDDVIDDIVRKINHDCVLLIARQQPVASDLRDITSNLKLITDFERMADHAEDIAVHVTRMVAMGYLLDIPDEISRMFDQAKDMTRTALDAYVSRDREKALKVMKMDDKVDHLYGLAHSQLVAYMKNDSFRAEGYVNLLMIAKHIERCADHAENVAEWVMYYLEGAYDIDLENEKQTNN